MKSIFTLLLVMVCCSVQRANATIRTFQFYGTITTSNIAGVSVGDPFVAVLSYDDAEAPYSAGSGYALYNGYAYTVTVAGQTFSKQAGNILQVNNTTGQDQISVAGNFPVLNFSLDDRSATAFSSTALPTSLLLPSFSNGHAVFWEATATSVFVGNITSITSCVTDPIVTTNADAGPGSLRQAVIDACPGSTITFDMNQVTSPISLSGGQIIIDKNLTIQGPGASLLTVQNTMAQSSISRVFSINSGVTATISGLTISGGNLSSGAAGGGIFNLGTVNFTNSTISNNSAPGGGSGIFNNAGATVNFTNSTISNNSATGSVGGGGIFNNAGSTLTVTNSTISNNSGSGFGGGGIFNNANGMATVTNSTISNNSSTGSVGGGGIFNNAGGTLTVTNSTISNNSSTGGTGGGGIFNNTGTVNSLNSIIAGNIAIATPDFKGTVTSQGNNLIGMADGSSGWVASDFTGTIASPLNPLLGALADNGGPTMTHALLPGSPAINAGTNAGAPATDQRGITRPQQSTTDIGAFESKGFNINVSSGNNQGTVVSTAFANPLSVTVTSSFNEPVDGGIVTFTPPASGASSTIAGNPATITNGSATTGVVTANGIAGPYIVTAAAGDLSTSFSLNNEAGPCANITPISCATPATFSLSGDGIWNTATPCIDNTYGKEKIYSFTATTTGLHQIQVTARSGGPIDYSYKAASGGCSPTGWTCINADSGYPFGPLTAGVTYYILVDAAQTIAASQTFQINCPVDPCLSIPTISCETPVTSNHSGPGAWIVTACGANTPGQEKVYSFTPAVTGIYNLGITPTSGHSIDYFYKAASDGCDATDWNCIGTTYSATSFSIGTLTGGTAYYILLKSHGAASTSHTFQINCPAPTSVGNRVWNDTDGDGVQDGGEAGINGVTVNLKDGGGSVIATTTTAGDGNYLFSNLAAGAYSVVVVSATLPSGYSPTYDLDGIATPHTATFTLATGQTRTDVDFGYKQPPAVTCPANITVNNKTGLCGAYVTYPAATSSGNFGTLTYSIKSGSWFAVGTTNVTVKASSGASCSFTVTVKDVQKPVIVCPSNITVTAEANACTKAVNFSINAVDNCSGVVVTSVPASGSVFNVGTTTVTATATDLSGNKTTSTFTVKVKESQPPVIKIVATPLVLSWPANGSYQTINVSQFVLSVTDNCSIIPVSSVKITKVTSDEPDNASGDADGNTTNDMKIASDCKSVDLRRERNSKGNGRVYTIYVAVTDAGGNTGTASFKVIAPISQNGTTATDNGSACTVSSYCSGNSNRSAAGISAEEQIVKNEIPEGFMMEQNYPNPFSSVTTIRYALPVEAKVSLGVYNQLGQRVTQLVDGRRSAGYHQASFDATKLAAGIYLYRLLAVGSDGKPVVLTKKMIVAK